MIKSYTKNGIHVLYMYYADEPVHIDILEIAAGSDVLNLPVHEEERIKKALYRIEAGEVEVEILTS